MEDSTTKKARALRPGDIFYKPAGELIWLCARSRGALAYTLLLDGEGVVPLVPSEEQGAASRQD